MNHNQLLNLILEIGEYMLSTTKKYITKDEFVNYVGSENLEYQEIILKSLKSLKKIESNPGAHGGIKYVAAQKRRPEILETDKRKLKSTTKILLAKHNLKKKNKAPELRIQNNFANWLKRKEKDNPDILIGFNQDGKKNGDHKNVDGYLIEIEQFKYHIKFKPILTTYEVKTKCPTRNKDLNQPINYKKFSHYVWLVFSDPRPINQIKEYLYNKEIIKTSDGIGIYVTNDEKEFHMIKRPIKQNPDEYQVDCSIDNLLTTVDKEELLKLKSKYFSSKIISLLN